METPKEIFEKRDGMSESEATERAFNLTNSIYNAIGEGASYDDIEEMMLGEGLEMDYIFDLI